MLTEPRRSQALLASGACAAFLLSAATDPRVLAGAAAVALLAFRRGALGALRRVAVAVLPPVALLSLGSWAWLRLVAGGDVAVAPFVSMALRTVVIAFVTLSILGRADLLRALAPFPTLSRLLVLSLGQIHALRRVATESAEGFRSRAIRRPRTRDAIRNAGGVTAALLALASRNARDAADAMRSRGF